MSEMSLSQNHMCGMWPKHWQNAAWQWRKEAFKALCLVGDKLCIGKQDVFIHPLSILICVRDLKPLNVFLDTPDPNRYHHYPKPVLGDFGLAFRTDANDHNNPRWYNDMCGTEGYWSPGKLALDITHI